MLPGTRRRCGFVLVTMMVSTVAVLSVIGLAIDTGHLQLVKVRMQTAADAGALGAVQARRASGSADVVAAARTDAGVNGCRLNQACRNVVGNANRVGEHQHR